MAVYGYARVSTQKQIIERQTENILRYDSTVKKIYSEKFTGTTSERPEWQKLLKVIESGDTIIFDSVSRMSRNAEEGVKQYFELYEKGINLVFLNEPYINTETYQKAISIHIQSVGNTVADFLIDTLNQLFRILAEEQIKQAFDQAEKEVTDLQRRTSEGMKTKGATSKWKKDTNGNFVLDEDGKKICLEQGKISKARTNKKYETKKAKLIKETILKHCKYFGGSLDDKTCIQIARCSVGTYYRYKKELIQKQEQEQTENKQK
jgi:DNA invertase Pin-like site-specific DNA recombinase